MMMTLIDPDDGVVVEPNSWWRRHGMALFPALLVLGVGLAVYLWPSQQYDVTPLVKPPVAEAGSAVPQMIVTVKQGEAVGAEAYWKGFRLNTGWHLEENDHGRYDLVGNVTNIEDAPDTARVLVQIRVGERDADMLMCRVSLEGGETKPLICADTNHAAYTSRWARITISAL